MHLEITIAKRELYAELRRKLSEVIGAGITQSGRTEKIVIYLTHANSRTNSLIPSTYKGNKVVTEIRSMAKAV